MATSQLPQTVQSFGIPTPITLTSADDLNNITRSGWYAWGATNPSNIPSNTSYCSLIVENLGYNCRQTVIRANGTNTGSEWVRHKFTTNSSWSSWTQTL